MNHLNETQFETLHHSGIDIDEPHLQRQDLVEPFADWVWSNRFLRLTAPPASGKTSLLQLIEHRLGAHVVWISCLDPRPMMEVFRNATGIDLENKTVTRCVMKKPLIVFLDDAEASFDDTQFWLLLVKAAPSWLPSRFRFVVSSNYKITDAIDHVYIPMGFGRKELLLSAEEGEQFLNSNDMGLPEKMRYPSLKTVLINQCNGLIGALSMSVLALNERFNTVTEPSEQALLDFILSHDFLSSMSRCFGSTHSLYFDSKKNGFNEDLKKVFVDEHVQLENFKTSKDDTYYTLLMKDGILVERYTDYLGRPIFSSILAKRYLFDKVFSGRAKTTPASLQEVVRNSIQSVSSETVKSFIIDKTVPKNVALLRLFMEALARSTASSCSICPDLSQLFRPLCSESDKNNTNEGKMDVFLKGSFRWGIELLVDEDGIDEYNSSFSEKGRYSPLNVDDYMVVTFCLKPGQPKHVSLDANRITVFFEDEKFSTAQCLFGMNDTAVPIHLAD